MSESNSNLSRRHFVTISVTGAAIAGAAGAAGWALTRRAGDEDAAPPAPGEQMEAELQKLARVDPALLCYRRQSVLASDLRGAVDLAAGPAGIDVALDRSIRRLNSDGALRQQIDLTSEPRCVHPFGDGVLVGFTDHIAVYDNAGSRVEAWEPFGGRPRLTSIASQKGEIAVGDAGNRTVWRLDSAGKVAGRIMSRFIIPSPYLDVHFDKDRTLWVANIGKHRLEAYDPESKLVRSWGTPAGSMGAGTGGFSGCCNPCHFTRLPDGRFVTSEKGFNRITLYHADGQFDGFVADHVVLGTPTGRMTCDQHDAANAPPIVAPAPGSSGNSGGVLVLCPATGELQSYVPAS